MITFCVSIVFLVLGYFIYGAFVEKLFGIDPKAHTPAIDKADGVDFVPMKPWRIFLIQFLNIAGLGPIFGAVMGIFYGPSAFLWIVFGSIFAGGVHDYFSGMMSDRMGGASLPDIIGNELGHAVMVFMRVLCIVLLVLLASSFLSGVALLLEGVLPLPEISIGDIERPFLWILIIMLYYVLATVLPVDKLIGRFYPVFGFVLLFMAVGIMVVMMFHHSADMPEVFDGLQNRSGGNIPLFPMMFVSIACGAISGFHGTQSPMMARCITSERQGRRIFYGAMICEGILALIWAAAAGTFFADPEKGLYGIDGLKAFAAQHPNENVAALVVNTICRSWLGTVGGILAIIGVILAPITSGDTALRSASLIIADISRVDQTSIRNRLLISMPLILFVVCSIFVNFDIIWRYFSWVNQSIATFTLWAASVYLYKQEHKVGQVCRYPFGYLLTLIPALFMTMVSSSYFIVAPEGLDLANKGVAQVAYVTAFFVSLGCFALFRGTMSKNS